MYIYNVTINIDESLHDQWLKWMQSCHIPDMLATGKFTQAKMCRVRVEEEMCGITYSIQYTTRNLETLQSYYDQDAALLREEATQKFKGKFVAFRTELEVVDVQDADLSGATHYLFTYGTLRDEAVQTHVFSRKLEGSTDFLPGYRLSPEKIAGLYPTIEVSPEPGEHVAGKVYLVSDPDLALADSYEGVGYHRIKIVLNSGIEAWVYLKNPNLFQP
jgi:gamma-glutamylcyclotransferase (GGCT)/AIG2-like uncharacterized protein YtfP